MRWNAERIIFAVSGSCILLAFMLIICDVIWRVPAMKYAAVALMALGFLVACMSFAALTLYRFYEKIRRRS